MKLIAALIPAVLALSSCAAFSDDTTTAGSGEVQVATAFYPLQYVAGRVAGEHASIVNLTQPGQEPHDLELTIKETADVAEADLVVYEQDFQPAVDSAIDQNATGATLDAAEVVGLEPLDHDGHDHDHGDLDPHFWQDPTRMAVLGDAVAEQLSDIDPDHADEYAANAADLRSDLEDLDASYSSGLARCERDTVVVSHDAFGYLAEKYGLVLESIAGLSPEAEPTPADLGRLQDLIDSAGVTTVFSERLASPKLAESLANDMGIDTAVLDPIEGLSDETADDDYLSLMEQNLTALEKANGC